MAISNNVKWGKNDEVKLRNIVKRFNAKVTRVSKKHPEIAYLQPPKISVKGIRETLKGISRKEINWTLKKYENYLRKGAELPYTTKQGVNTTVWQKKEIDRAVRTINARNKALIKKYEPSTYKGTMGTIEQNNLKPRKNRVQQLLPKDWGRYVENLEKQLYRMSDNVRQGIYMENYLKALDNVLGENNPVTEYVKKNVSPAQLEEFYYNEPLLQIDYIYSPDEAQEIIKTMLERFSLLLSQ